MLYPERGYCVEARENGFYYRPAFHSKNLVFRNVDIRHFVVEPLFLPNTFTLNQDATSKRYCTWTPGSFPAL